MPLMQQITEQTYYLPGANNLGIVTVGDGGAIAIDTGIDKDTGRSIRRALDEAGLQLLAIVSTHHHADHIGGNEYLVRNLPGVRVYAPPIEAGLIEHPVLEPVYLNMGARPIGALRTKWVMARGAPVHHLIEADRLEIAGAVLEVLPLPGHSINQIGLAIDGVCFAADGFFGPSVLQKHGIPYAHAIDEQLASIDRLRGRAERFFLPGHGDLTPREVLAEALDANCSAIMAASEAVRRALAEPGDLAAVARRVGKILNLSPAGVPQYAIFVSVIAAHLSYLEAQGLAEVCVDHDGMIWLAR